MSPPYPQGPGTEEDRRRVMNPDPKPAVEYKACKANGMVELDIERQLPVKGSFEYLQAKLKRPVTTPRVMTFVPTMLPPDIAITTQQAQQIALATIPGPPSVQRQGLPD
eukprot:5856853-Amphidinium_carterae.2